MLILGHRGVNEGFEGSAYQNSHTAFRQALEFADGLETDAARTQDDVVFLVHDIAYGDEVRYTLQEHLNDESARIMEGRRLDQINAREAENLRLVSDETLPSLWDLLKLAAYYPSKCINVELKGEDTAGPVIETLSQAREKGWIRNNQIIISSFNFPELRRIRRMDPELRISMLFDLENKEKTAMFPWSENRDACYTPFRPEELDAELVQRIKPEFFGLEQSCLRPEIMKEIATRFGTGRVIGWTSGEPLPQDNHELVGRLRDPSIAPHMHAFITDYPRDMKTVLR